MGTPIFTADAEPLADRLALAYEVLALRLEDAGHLDQIAPWDFVRHLDVAGDLLTEF